MLENVTYAKLTAEHKKFNEFQTKWSKCRAAFEGEEAIKKGGEKYIPKLAGQSDAEFKAYIARGNYFNASGRTLDGLLGMLTRRDTVLNVPERFRDGLFDDILYSGEPFSVIIRGLLNEVLQVGRVGIWIDYPYREDVFKDEFITVFDVERMGDRPYWVIYKTEDIFNWRVKNVNGRTVLAEVRVWETLEREKSEFEYETVKQVRVLDLKDGGRYRQRVFRQASDGKPFELIGEFYPLMNGQYMDFIPFYILDGLDNNISTIENPPLLDLVNTNLAHWRNSVDYEYGLHYTALPTPVISGYSEGTAKGGTTGGFSIGPGEGWTLKDPQAKAYYLEFEGKGLGAIDVAMSKKEQHMALLGARMLSPDKRMTETAETAEIHRQGEQSVLASIASLSGHGLTQAVITSIKWAGQPDINETEVWVDINDNFSTKMLDHNSMVALMRLWQGGAIGFQTLYDNFVDGGVISPDMSIDEVMEDISVSAMNRFRDGDL
jgi:hypothetical protein